MKKLYLLLTTASLTLSIQTVSRAAIVTGSIFCDANQDGVLDTGDIAVPGVTVVITNQIGSFSNSAVSAVDGSFNMSIPNFDPILEVHDPLAQIYFETVQPATLPAGSTVLLPVPLASMTNGTPLYVVQFAANQTNLVFTSGTGDSTTGDWLINDPECGVSAGACKVSGNARIMGGRGVGEHSFGGTIVSGNPPRGRWTDISRNPRLVFQSTSVQSVTCGTGTIEFSGNGRLRSLGPGNQVQTQVSFTVEVENQAAGTTNKTGATAYYLRVFTTNGNTLDLVSTDTADPTNVAPVSVTSGHLGIRSE